MTNPRSFLLPLDFLPHLFFHVAPRKLAVHFDLSGRAPVAGADQLLHTGQSLGWQVQHLERPGHVLFLQISLIL